MYNYYGDLMQTLKNTIESKIEIKKSRFISIIKNIQPIEEFNTCIEELKVKYPKATHYCQGYICGNIERFSDDGEPGGTAGTPILNVLKKENLNNICCVVIRYFGGIKLGAGGLVRAYTKSVTEALKSTEFIELEIGYKARISFQYSQEKQINYILNNSKVLNKEFLENVVYTVLINDKVLEKLNNYDLEILEKLYIEKVQFLAKLFSLLYSSNILQ